MDVGVRELKQRLSEYLDRVERGEIIRVTDRGKPKALLTPIIDGSIVDAGVREGWLKLGEQTAPRSVLRAKARRRILEVLRDDREEE
ncbi:MAG: type II toxin-antitoxin system prevent-host-death family antitoxin [Deltaproteobacteria bacterium]|nr:type II toxin-antitoxin system prevent-host-death family antitoxin [Deltaproteobacteria bacterium]